MTVGQIIAEPMRVHEILPKAQIQTARRRAAAAGGPLPLHGAALSARAVGRPAPARRHRPGARGRPARDRLRRGGVRARRVDPGPGDQPAGGPAAEAGPDLPVHRPRSGRGAPHLDQGRRHVSRAASSSTRRPTSCSPTPSTPTRRRCWRRRRSPIPSSSAPGRAPSSRASCRARSIRPPAACSIRAARWRPRNASRRCRPRGSLGRDIWWPASMPSSATRHTRQFSNRERKMKRTILRTAIASVAALALGSGLAAAQTPKKGGMLNFGVVAEPPNYDCHGSTTFALIHPIAPHYSLLVKFDGKDYPEGRSRPGRELDGGAGRHDLHLQDPLGRQVPRRLAAHLRGHQGQLRSHHQPAGRAWSRSARPTTPTSPSRRRTRPRSSSS